MFTFGERSRRGAVSKFKIQGFRFTSLGSDVADGRFGRAIDQQRDGISAVPAEGLEPTRSCDHWILSLVSPYVITISLTYG